MANLKTIFMILFGSQLLALFIVTSNYYNLQETTVNISSRVLDSPDTVYRFDEIDTSYNVLKALDVSSIYTPENTSEKELKNMYKTPFYGISNEEDYCDRHRAYFVTHPEVVFQQKNFMTSYKSNAILRWEVIPSIGGRDVMPYVHSKMEVADKLIYDLREDVTHYFTAYAMFESRQIGKQFSCLSQSSNHIPGRELMYRKDMVGANLNTYAKRYLDRPQCFSENKFFPKTWILYEEDQCKAFFKLFNSEEYQEMKRQRKLVFIRKIGAGVHQGQGVFPFNSTEEETIHNMYKSGDLCGINLSNNLIQYAVWNPLLLNGRKFDFRMFMLIASTNPLVLYYRDGFLRVSLRDYDPDSKEIGSILTNIALSKVFFHAAKENGTYNGFTEEELMNQAFWDLPKLGHFLYAMGNVTDPNWLDNYLRPEFKRAMIHLLRMSQGPLIKRSSLYEIYGLDFMLDDNLNLWFIEANAQPLLDGWSPDTKKFFNSILVDSFEIVYGLLKSRMKRAVQFVNKIVADGDAWKDDNEELHIRDLEGKRNEFNRITYNYFEPEFEPSASNEFYKIIDENLPSSKQYMGFITEECY